MASEELPTRLRGVDARAAVEDWVARPRVAHVAHDALRDVVVVLAPAGALRGASREPPRRLPRGTVHLLPVVDGPVEGTEVGRRAATHRHDEVHAPVEVQHRDGALGTALVAVNGPELGHGDAQAGAVDEGVRHDARDGSDGRDDVRSLATKPVGHEAAVRHAGSVDAPPVHPGDVLVDVHDERPHEAHVVGPVHACLGTAAARIEGVHPRQLDRQRTSSRPAVTAGVGHDEALSLCKVVVPVQHLLERGPAHPAVEAEHQRRRRTLQPAGDKDLGTALHPVVGHLDVLGCGVRRYVEEALHVAEDALRVGLAALELLRVAGAGAGARGPVVPRLKGRRACVAVGIQRSTVGVVPAAPAEALGIVCAAARTREQAGPVRVFTCVAPPVGVAVRAGEAACAGARIHPRPSQGPGHGHHVLAAHLALHHHAHASQQGSCQGEHHERTALP
mmetsp:Transcript_90804/g.283936  ORF Transcript_90804/g.283936 Transcript_90804/m.283936 type:complete len:448 (+) Transcript_90804:384-1727(+)